MNFQLLILFPSNFEYQIKYLNNMLLCDKLLYYLIRYLKLNLYIFIHYE